MIVNWQNLSVSIQNSQAAYSASNFGAPIDTGAIAFYDNPMSDFADSSAKENEDFPNAFSFGSSKWGQQDLVIK